MDAHSTPTARRLHLDVLELIVNEHRNDHATLAAIALASPSFLQMSRKHLYRSVSLNYCENPYGHEQQRQLRNSLASNPHLCLYIRNLRLSLPVTDVLDADLDDILHALSRVEHLHVIGNASGLDYDVVGNTPSYVLPMLGSVEFGSMGTTTTRSGRSVGRALKKVFKLRSLKKVKLENIDPLEALYVSCFTQLKHLELLCVGGGPRSLDSLPQSSSNTSSVDSASSNSASMSTSRSGTSLASHPPPSIRPSSSFTSSSLRSSPDSSASHSDASILSSPDTIVGPNEDRRGTTTQTSLAPAILQPHITPDIVCSGSPGFTGEPDCSLINLAGSISPARPHWTEIGTMKQSGRASPRKVRLEYLVLNLERLRPVLDVICRGSALQERGSMLHGSDEKDMGSVLDFSGLKQAHIYVWDSDDGNAVWSILDTARKSLERLTLRYFDFGEEHFSYHQGFDNLQSLVLGTRTFSVRDQDPFRPLIRFLGDPSKFPSLKRVKISFDLWGCEHAGVSWKEVCGYRGWRELDGVCASLDGASAVCCRAPSSSSLLTGEPSVMPGEPQLASIVFELWCSPTYKMGQGGRMVGEGSLSSHIREELSYLKHNAQFLLL